MIPHDDLQPYYVTNCSRAYVSYLEFTKEGHGSARSPEAKTLLASGRSVEAANLPTIHRLSIKDRPETPFGCSRVS